MGMKETAFGLFAQQQHGNLFARRVDGGLQAGGAGAQNNHIVVCFVRHYITSYNLSRKSNHRNAEYKRMFH
jgi:hypothetical protein